MSFWEKPEFKKEQDYWYKKAAEDGFNDIETIHEELKQNSPNAYRQAQPIIRENKLEYFLLLDQFVNDDNTNFDNGMDLFVMQRFAEGLTNKAICQLLDSFGHSRHRKTVMFIRRKYENRWKIIKWKPSQLRSQVIHKKT
jgi:hypothetical protein